MIVIVFVLILVVFGIFAVNMCTTVVHMPPSLRNPEIGLMLKKVDSLFSFLFIYITQMAAAALILALAFVGRCIMIPVGMALPVCSYISDMNIDPTSNSIWKLMLSLSSHIICSWT